MTFKDAIEKNLVWVLTTLLAIGAFGATVNYQGKEIERHNKELIEGKSADASIDKRLVRIEVMVEGIQSDLKIMKEDMKDMKRVIMKPAFNVSDDVRMLSSNQLVSVKK
jgi:hypothetical protein